MIAALLVSLGGCGTDQGSAGEAGDESSGPGSVPTKDFSYDVVALVSGSAAHGPGVKGSRPTRISDEAALDRFAGQFQGPLPASLRQQGGAALAYLADGQALTATVVAVGCEPPTKVTVTHDGGALSVEAVPVESNIQCLVPVTTVALVAVPAAYAGG